MAIISRLLNKTFNIYRVTTPTPSSPSFEIGEEQFVLVSRNIAGRLSRTAVNEPVREGVPKDLGLGSGYKNKIFFAAGTDVQVGDRIMEAGVPTNKFYVDYVNDLPGGVANHIECEVSASDFMAVS